MSQLRKLERRERADLGRLDDHRVARGQARCHLPREHHQRVVPRGDQAANPDGFALGDAEIPVQETRYKKGSVRYKLDMEWSYVQITQSRMSFFVQEAMTQYGLS